MRSLVLAAALLTLFVTAPARACRDAGPPFTPLVPPFDAGEGCGIVRDSCGSYVASCDAGPPDAGTDAGPIACTPYHDAGVDGPAAERWACTTNADCPSWVANLACGADGFCECVAPAEPEATGCNASAGASSSATAWLFGVAALAFLRRRARSS